MRANIHHFQRWDHLPPIAGLHGKRERSPGQRFRIGIAYKMKSYVCWMIGSSGLGAFGTLHSRISEEFGHKTLLP
jgi:hypothetical protein